MVDAGFVNQAGQRVIAVDLLRHRKGIRVKVRIDPEIEAFFQQWSGGAQEGPVFGRNWKAFKDGEKLAFWSFGERTPDEGFSLQHTGGHFFTEQDVVNISFLRLVGASSGIEFIHEGVMGRSEMEKIGEKLRRAFGRFYTEYIQPVHIQVSVRDMQKGAAQQQ